MLSGAPAPLHLPLPRRPGAEELRTCNRLQLCGCCHAAAGQRITSSLLLLLDVGRGVDPWSTCDPWSTFRQTKKVATREPVRTAPAGPNASRMDVLEKNLLELKTKFEGSEKYRRENAGSGGSDQGSGNKILRTENSEKMTEKRCTYSTGRGPQDKFCWISKHLPGANEGHD